jgi:hypothetical protein
MNFQHNSISLHCLQTNKQQKPILTVNTLSIHQPHHKIGCAPSSYRYQAVVTEVTKQYLKTQSLSIPDATTLMFKHLAPRPP